MRTTIPISSETRDYIIAHMNDRPRTAVAKAAGVSMSTFYRVVKASGGVIDHSLCRRHPAWWDTYILEHYPNESTVDIAKRLGTNKGRVYYIANQLGVAHSDDFIKRQKAELMKKLIASRANLDRQAIAAKNRAARHRDEIRAKYGLPRLTKFRFRKMPVRVYKVIWCLTTKYNYHKDSARPYCLMFDDNTRRMHEDYYKSKYGLKFQQA